jgi:hypothetical protein
MPNKKITELPAAATLATTDLVPVVTDPGGSAATKKATMATVAARVLTAPAITGGATIAGGAAIAGGATVSSGGIAVTGNSTITGTLAGLTALGVAGTATASTFAGSGASLTNISATAISTGTLDSARLPATLVFPTIVGAAASPKNTLKLGDADTLLLTLASGSALPVSDGGNGTTATIAGFDGPTGTNNNAGAISYLRVSIAGNTNWYIPVLQFT